MDAERRELLLDGDPLALRPKLFDTLAYLIERRDRVVEKEELLDAVWSGVHVEESTLFQTVSALRKELGRGGAGGGRAIKTIPGRGYRFVGEAKPLSVAQAPEPVAAPAELPSVRRAVRRRWLTPATLSLLALAAWSGWPRSELNPPGLVEVPLTSYPGSERSPSFSPDASLVAYSRIKQHGQDSDIYLQVVGGGNARAVVASPAGERGPAISPDGGSIAYWRQESPPVPGSTLLMVASILGGGERPIYAPEIPFRGATHLTKLSWSPDGTKIAISLRSEDGGPWRLGLVSVLDRDLTWLTPAAKVGDGDSMPAFSPDGRWIAFVRGLAGGETRKSIWLLPVSEDGRPAGDPVPLTGPGIRASAPAWMPGGREILFIGQQGRGMEGIWSVPSTGGEPTLVWRQPGVDEFPSLAVGRRADGGVRIAYGWRPPKETDIYRVPLSGPGRCQAEKVISTTQRDSLAQYSPDGRRIAYFSGWPERDVWVANADGSNPRRLTQHAIRAARPLRWSPDGERIAFSSGFERSLDLYVVDASGGAARRLTDDPRDDVRPTWSRDGAFVYFSRMQTGPIWDLWKIPAQGGPVEPVARGEASFNAALESLDGDLIRFVSLESGAALWEASLENGLPAEAKRVHAFPQILWAAELVDRGVYFAHHKVQGKGPLYFLDFATGEVEELCEFPGWLSSVHPDESSILTVVGPQTGPDLKMLTPR